jgi:hypothetical protein
MKLSLNLRTSCLMMMIISNFKISRLLNGVIVKENDRVHTERNQKKSLLIINSAEESDTGVYTLKATNDVAQDVLNINVVVEGEFKSEIQRVWLILHFFTFETSHLVESFKRG